MDVQRRVHKWRCTLLDPTIPKVFLQLFCATRPFRLRPVRAPRPFWWVRLLLCTPQPGMAQRKPKRTSGLLKGSRLITGNKVPKGLKPQKSRELIRRFHNLQKWKALILRELQSDYPDLCEANYKVVLRTKLSSYLFTNDELKALSKLHHGTTGATQSLLKTLAAIDAEISYRGGLETYQRASTQGQDSKRGGDSSKRLVEWLNANSKSTSSLRALEIGSLLETNLISTCKIFSSVTRIDLHSQSPAILEQDFMQRPLPRSDDDRFNLISCSLVLNFVPTPALRGEMLKRITKFLLPPKADAELTTASTLTKTLALFLVLPLPCVSNSRYCTHKQLKDIMSSLGFIETRYYEAKKVAYWLYNWHGPQEPKKFAKKELEKGANRNNFCIVLE